jgi:hypothetical protein
MKKQPFADIFSQVKILSEFKIAAKEGSVSIEYDKDLAKKVVSITGTTSANNNIQIPSTKSLPTSSLGLAGSYVSIFGAF